MFDPKTNHFPYPLQTDGHYLEVRKDRGLVFDSRYPYVETRPWFRLKCFFVRILLWLIVFPVMRLRLGLRVEGRKQLKAHKALIRQGMVSCCNHVHMWDYIAIMYALRPVRPYVLIWAKNINGENGTMMRHTGGIPIPEGDPAATFTYLKAVKKLLQEGNWLHIYPEGSMWEYYAPIRPFKAGPAYIACHNDKPLLPLAFRYRKPNWIRKHLFRQTACLTLQIGSPLLRDAALDKKEQIADLTIRSHQAVCRLAGIDPAANQYPPLFDPDIQRVDYYTRVYGVNYTGSW